MSQQQLLLQVTAPHFCAGLVLQHGRCVQAAPILGWAVTRPEPWLRAYFARKRWRIVAVRPASMLGRAHTRGGG